MSEVQPSHLQSELLAAVRQIVNLITAALQPPATGHLATPRGDDAGHALSAPGCNRLLHAGGHRSPPLFLGRS